MAKQFVVELKNEPGAMATLAESLAARGVDLRAIGGGSIGDSGHVIMTTADDDTAKAVLDEKGYNYIEGESILAEVDDRPGGMARLARSLADANVNIYGHLFLGRWGDRAMFAFVVDDPDGPPDPRAQGLASARPVWTVPAWNATSHRGAGPVGRFLVIFWAATEGRQRP